MTNRIESMELDPNRLTSSIAPGCDLQNNAPSAVAKEQLRNQSRFPFKIAEEIEKAEKGSTKTSPSSPITHRRNRRAQTPIYPLFCEYVPMYQDPTSPSDSMLVECGHESLLLDECNSNSKVAGSPQSPQSMIWSYVPCSASQSKVALEKNQKVSKVAVERRVNCSYSKLAADLQISF